MNLYLTLTGWRVVTREASLSSLNENDNEQKSVKRLFNVSRVWPFSKIPCSRYFDNMLCVIHIYGGGFGMRLFGDPKSPIPGIGDGDFSFRPRSKHPRGLRLFKIWGFFPQGLGFFGDRDFFRRMGIWYPGYPKKNPPLFIYIYENLVILKKFLLDIKFFCKTVLAKILWTRQFVD